MAANMYYQLGCSEIQADDNGLQTLHLMHPTFVGYSHAPPPPQSAHQQFMGIHENHPSHPPPVLQEDDQIQAVHNTLIQRFRYNRWGLADPEHHQTPVQGLSLSLNSPQQSRTAFDTHRQDFPARSSIGRMNVISPGNCSSHQSLTATDDQSTGVISMQSVVMGSKYLKAAQELLDEVASVGKSSAGDRPEKAPARDKMAAKMMKESTDEISGTELTTAQRQEIQMKKAKLNAMLDEVEQRYRQYHQQMQIVVISFEQAAGLGSAKAYTHVALKTILKQFRGLRAAISGRIKALSRSLGEEERTDGKKTMEGSMRLKFVDHQQIAAMHQQMGMIMHNNNINNAWRPQRGLPERAVSVLRAWLFEHFLHPYPKDADKQMLAKQTGLTRSQVSNWFINARVRLWKPMVEEMYLEEIKNNDNNNQQPHEISSKIRAHDHPDKLQYSSSQKTPAKKQRIKDDPHQDNSLSSSILSVDETETIKQPANHQTSMTFSNVVQFGNTIGDHNHEQTRDNQNYFPSMASENTRDQIRIGGLGRFNGGDQYQNMEGNFQGNNSFSLSLALPPSRETSLRIFEFGTRIESGLVESNRVRGMINQGNPNNIGNYDQILDLQNRKPFPAHQRLPDFVA